MEFPSKFSLTIQRALPPKPSVGRVAMVVDEKWNRDIAQALLDLGFEVLAIPGWLYIQKEHRSDKTLYFQFTQYVETLLKEWAPIDFILDINGGIMFVKENQQLCVLGEELGIKTVCWWFDDPKYGISDVLRYEILPVYSFLKELARKTIKHFFIDRSWVREYKTFFKYPFCFHLPGGASKYAFNRVETVKKDTPLLFIGNYYQDKSSDLIQQHQLDSVYKHILRPVFELKKKNLKSDFRSLLSQLPESNAQSEFTQKISNPLHSDHFNLYYHSWWVVTHLFSSLRNEFVDVCAQLLQDKFQLFGRYWDTIYDRAPFFVDGNANMNQWFNRSCWGLNAMNGQEQSGLAIRIWEHAGSGLPTFSQDCEEIADYFEPGEECFVFSSTEALKYLLEKYLQDFTVQKKMSMRLYKRFLEEHTWHHRVEKLLRLVTNEKY